MWFECIKEKMKKIILLFILPLFLTGCLWLLPSKVIMTLSNKSYDTIFVSLKSTYEDTLFFKYTTKFDDLWTGPYGGSYDSKTFSTTGKDAYDYDAFFYWSDTISIFILHYGTIKKYDYEDIRKNNRILARYDLRLQDVDAFDGYFEYPPSQRMIDSGMKIYINPNNPDL